MGSTRQQERSIGGGMSLPQWMKGKVDTRFDFEESTFSPPSHDDSFFCIRYPKTQTEPASTEGFRTIGQVFSETNSVESKTQGKLGQQEIAESKGIREVDFSKHPLPCQPFVPGAANRGNEVKGPRITLARAVKGKSQGTDDGFHGEPALCGKSIVHVANQMMSSKFSKPLTADEAEAAHPRRGSKSLPATPIASPAGSPDSSPRARRKLVSNRYFTGSFLPDREKYQGGWILASILGQSRELVNTKIDEEDESSVEIPPPRTLSRKKSISSQNLTYIGKEEKPPGTTAAFTNVFQPKPSELREMNFWSPTSM